MKNTTTRAWPPGLIHAIPSGARTGSPQPSVSLHERTGSSFSGSSFERRPAVLAGSAADSSRSRASARRRHVVPDSASRTAIRARVSCWGPFSKKRRSASRGSTGRFRNGVSQCPTMRAARAIATPNSGPFESKPKSPRYAAEPAFSSTERANSLSSGASTR
ncbi:MAG: hypothetical protein M0D55_11105 [Elusimicrobiota bacterium]|nr:MAG: hypothetical protein M0D55_11105 [Elusimicrobiota bacterium]